MRGESQRPRVETNGFHSPQRLGCVWGRVRRDQRSCTLSKPPRLQHTWGRESASTGVSHPPSHFLSWDRVPRSGSPPPGAAQSLPRLGLLPPVPGVPARGPRVWDPAGQARWGGRWPSASPPVGAGERVQGSRMRGGGAVSRDAFGHFLFSARD